MKNRSLIYISFIISFPLASPACQAWNFASSLRNAVRSCLGFRLMNSAKTRNSFRSWNFGPKPSFKHFGFALAGSAALPTIINQKSAYHQSTKSAPNCQQLQQVLEEENNINAPKPLSGSFSATLNGFLKCKKGNNSCMGMMHSLEKLRDDIHIKQEKKLQVSNEIQVTDVAMNIETKDEGTEYKQADIKLSVHGNINCEKGSGCNDKLYLMSKCSQDFGTCIKTEFNKTSPRSQKCSSIFNLFGLDSDSILPSKDHDDESTGITDLDVEVRLDEENSKAWWA